MTFEEHMRAISSAKDQLIEAIEAAQAAGIKIYWDVGTENLGINADPILDIELSRAV